MHWYLCLIYSAKYIAKERVSDGSKVSFKVAANKNSIDCIRYCACCTGYFGRISVSLGLGRFQWKNQIRENAVGLDAIAIYTCSAGRCWILVQSQRAEG